MGLYAWVDFPAMSDGVGPLSGGERRYLLMTTSISGITVPLNLAEIAYLDNDLVDLILRGLAHAYGTGAPFDRLDNASEGNAVSGQRGLVYSRCFRRPDEGASPLGLPSHRRRFGRGAAGQGCPPGHRERRVSALHTRGTTE